MKTIVDKPFRPIYPSPAGLIVSVDTTGKPNVMTAGEIFNISLVNPCIIGIALRKATYTHGLIVASKEFSVNIPTTAMLKQVDQVGTISGRDGLDKFAAYGLTPLASQAIQSPIIAECPLNLECQLLSVTEVGDHDLFLGQVVKMHVDSDKLDTNQKMNIADMDAFMFAEWGYYGISDKIGHFGFSRQDMKEETTPHVQKKPPVGDENEFPAS